MGGIIDSMCIKLCIKLSINVGNIKYIILHKLTNKRF